MKPLLSLFAPILGSVLTSLMTQSSKKIRSCTSDGKKIVSLVKDGTLIAKVIADSRKVKKEIDKLEKSDRGALRHGTKCGPMGKLKIEGVSKCMHLSSFRRNH